MNGRILLTASYLFFAAITVHSSTNEAVRVFMPDGQIKSHFMRVFVTRDLTEADKPELFLLPGRLLLRDVPEWAKNPIPILELARAQYWTEEVHGQKIGFTGTLLLFDLRNSDFPVFKASMRITPIVKWGEPRETAVAEHSVYIGNLLAASFWTLLVMGAFVGLVYVFTGPGKEGSSTAGSGARRSLKLLLLSPDGRLSLSKTQAAVWTLCVGGVVFCFGLTRFEPPQIPDSLVALLGLSLGTRAVCHVHEKKWHPGSESSSTGPTPRSDGSPALRDLVYSGVSGKPELAITKAQMLFWTCLAVCLFCVKSLLDGALWEVPWQLVTLMGISHASYMVPIVKAKDPAVST